VVELLLEHEVGGDERAVEAARPQPRRRVAGSHLDELETADRGPRPGPPEGRGGEPGVAQQRHHELAQAPP
jgi:hypothetical protein